MRKKAFTLVELVIVMAIIGIMLLMTKNYFTSANKIYYEGETCINNFYYTLKDINSAALLGRTRTLSGIFFSGGNNIESPDWYTVILRTPSYYNNPQFPINVETASGLIQTLWNNPTASGSLGLYSGQNITTAMLNGWAYFYRGTGNIVDTLDTTGSTYGIVYLPIGGVNHINSPDYTPMKGCTANDFFVTYTISTAYSDATALRIGFQNAATISDKKMLIQPGQRSSGSLADLNTGAINFQVCNKSDKCKETYRIFFDTRVNDLFLQKCSQYTGNMKCDLWQGGDIN